ncbi:sensor histidine kinase [Polaribacter sargassicola]|uniref:sensor histidine kinase n=1 Tax=Polaribacter sargassicola TaxID=2836891 RepID=UPI001F27407C|nr:PAS domain S-box protein [Polaribacter sp. DS7-9]MCG1036763.1 PAS domain S-box protein [Polaribacter sp. DS7-9]
MGINQYYKIVTKNQLEIIKTGAKNDLNVKSILINDTYKSLSTGIDIIQMSFFNNGIQEKEKVTNFLLHLSKLHTNYDQVRYLDTLGQEILRVDFDSINGAKVQENNKLQNKGNRYYYKNTTKLNKDEIYFSNIDLNIDFGKIEIPYNPVLRVSSKVYDQNNKWCGIIIINFFMKDLFNKLTTHSKLKYSSFELLNKDGYYLSSKNKIKNFSHILSNSDSLSLKQTHKNLWDKIQQNNSGNYIDKNIIYVYKKIIIDNKSTNNVNYKQEKSLILINQIDLKEVKKSQIIYVVYLWSSFIILSIFILFVLINIQFFYYNLQDKNKQLLNNNKQLKILKNKIQETLDIKLDELSLTERKFYSIFNSAGINIALADLNGRPVFANKKFINTFGYSEEEITKLTFKDFTHPDDVKGSLFRFKQLIDGKIEPFNIEKRYIRKDGSVIWINLFVSLLKDEHDNIINVIAIGNEITNLKNAQKETKKLKKVIKSLNYIAKVLNIESIENATEINESVNLVEYIEKQSEDILNANKAREELLKNLEHKNEELNNYAHIVSHDLKTPLRSIYTLFNWIEEDANNNFTEESKMYTQLILENLEKMESLIKGILSYSNLDQNKMQDYDINTYNLVNDIVKLMPIPKSIEIKIDPNLPTIISNKYRINQVFQNLLENAIKSIDKEVGIIEIGANENTDSWEFYIKDNGKGIDKKYFHKIFELFQCLDNPDKNLGMGLSIVKKVIQFYNGKIWLDSEVSKGTTFYFSLPKNA